MGPYLPNFLSVLMQNLPQEGGGGGGGAAAPLVPPLSTSLTPSYQFFHHIQLIGVRVLSQQDVFVEVKFSSKI